MAKAKIIKLRGKNRSVCDYVAGALRKGAVAAFPTDTVYGLGADFLCGKAVERIYKIKSRAKTKHLILMVGRKKDVFAVAENVPQSAERLIKKYWPGPLTLILNAALHVRMATGRKTVGIRMPAHGALLEILKKCPRPLATTSANISGEKSCWRFEDVEKIFKNKVDLIVDGGCAKHKLESTILDASVYPHVVLREGVIKKTELEKFI